MKPEVLAIRNLKSLCSAGGCFWAEEQLLRCNMTLKACDENLALASEACQDYYATVQRRGSCHAFATDVLKISHNP